MTGEVVVALIGEAVGLFITLLSGAYAFGKLAQKIDSNLQNANEKFASMQKDMREIRDRTWPLGPRSRSQ